MFVNVTVVDSGNVAAVVVVVTDTVAGLVEH